MYTYYIMLYCFELYYIMLYCSAYLFYYIII